MADKNRLLHDFKVEELAEDYENQGFEVLKNPKIGEFLADLVAKKDGHTVVIEVKTSEMLRRDKAKVALLAAYVRTLPNHKFELIMAMAPKPKRIDIEGLEQTLQNYLINEDFPVELDALSSHTEISEVTDTDIDQIYISEDCIEIVGTGSIGVVLRYGSNSDQDGTSTHMSFPIAFVVELSHDLTITELREFTVDVRSFYE